MILLYASKSNKNLNLSSKTIVQLYLLILVFALVENVVSCYLYT